MNVWTERDCSCSAGATEMDLPAGSLQQNRRCCSNITSGTERMRDQMEPVCVFIASLMFCSFTGLPVWIGLEIRLLWWVGHQPKYKHRWFSQHERSDLTSLHVSRLLQIYSHVWRGRRSTWTGTWDCGWIKRVFVIPVGWDDGCVVKLPERFWEASHGVCSGDGPPSGL